VPHTEPPSLWGSKPAALDVTYEDVRQSFLIRLHSEEARLIALSSALGSADVDAASAFVDLEMFAHRLRGAAAVFGLPELRDAAKGLELAAADAVAGRSSIGKPLIQEKVRILGARLTCLNAFTRSSVMVTSVPAN